ncbi:unnamed protein product [Gulo gulo]|nr:unnamed protein product [Gulo gulo]
MCLQKAI